MQYQILEIGMEQQNAELITLTELSPGQYHKRLELHLYAATQFDY